MCKSSIGNRQTRRIASASFGISYLRYPNQKPFLPFLPSVSQTIKISMKIKKSQQTYNTTDFYLSCFLLARGIQLIGLNQTDEPGRRSFVFVESDMRAILMDEYNFDAEAEINMRDFISAIRKLKTLLYEK